ncbi:hypothetical protein KCP78_06715 [Salmonella enterica subsp. enterica]|nr:hypothetical protein KCP78_06715 [Salmonella enterica subsp. enterica]
MGVPTVEALRTRFRSAQLRDSFENLDVLRTREIQLDGTALGEAQHSDAVDTVLNCEWPRTCVTRHRFNVQQGRVILSHRQFTAAHAPFAAG